MRIGISPMVDFVFKLILGSPEHPAITIHFLNAVLGGVPRITHVTILNPILDKDTDSDKLAVLDILARDEFGRQFNIEMQTSLPQGLSQRLLYYASSIYASQLSEGAEYVDLRPVMSICVLERPLFPHVPQLHLDFRLRDDKGLLLTDDFQIHLIELSKSRATIHNIQEVSRLEKWAFFLIYAEQLDAETLRQLLPDPEFDAAIGVLEMIQKTPEQKSVYDARLKFQRDAVAQLSYARHEGRQEGHLMGQINLLEQFLGLPQTTVEVLETLGADELTNTFNDLQARYKSRHG